MELPIFIINLDKDKDRKLFMKKQLDSLGLKYDFVTAFYGDNEEVIKACDDNLAIQDYNKVLTKGERGCAYSHSFIYKRMLKENIKEALILEDDVYLPDNFKEILETEVNRKGRNWEWLSFDYTNIGIKFFKEWLNSSFLIIKKKKIFFFYFLIKLPYIFIISLFEWLRNIIIVRVECLAGPKVFLRPLYNAGAYIVTVNGVKKLEKLFSPIRYSADRLPNRGRVLVGLKFRAYVPLVIKQNKNFCSNIEGVYE